MKKFSTAGETAPTSTHSSNTNTVKTIGLPGILLILLFALLAYISKEFKYDIPAPEKPVLALVSVLILSGLLYLITVYIVPRTELTGKQLIWIVLVGLALRFLMLVSTPMLEDDFYRYLWDGSVASHGLNPYQYSPEQVIENPRIPSELTGLKSESGEIINRVNHPYLRSIYPPVAQGFFAASSLIKPWSLTAWRLILLISDLATLGLLFYSLRIIGLPSAMLIIYWWNPLLVKEIFNSGHLDVLVFPFVLGAIMLAGRNRYLSSAVSIALGIGVKLWPAFLLPVIFKPLIFNPRKLIPAALLFITLIIFLLIPVYISGLDESSGFIAYGRRWQNNDSAFRALVFISEHALGILGYAAFHKYALARAIMAFLIILWVSVVTLKKSLGRDLFEKSLFIVAFVFLVSPAQFPWYYTWLVPFLTLRPRLSLLLPTLLLPLYYLRYYLEPRGYTGIFDNVVVWFEFVPVWILIFIEWKYGEKYIERA
ncbi:MAG: glycosyltransferase 87 family protein [Deltaproteobacteria bacterium]